MKNSYIDTDNIIRVLTKDDPKKAEAVGELLKRVRSGDEVVSAPVTVIADAVYTLSGKNYSFSRQSIRGTLIQIIKMPGFKLDNKKVILDALDIYSVRNVDFGDALLIASMKQDGITEIYSYDHDFNNIEDIKRIEP